MKFTLRQLDVFLATANYENVSRAAEHLAMSQSAASSALKELEQQFDIQLFDRIGKRLQLNALGKQIRTQAQALRDQSLELEHALTQHTGSGQLKVGATMTIGHDIAIDVIGQFKAQHPNSEVQLDIANTLQIAHDVEHFKLDVGLIEGQLIHPQLESISWLEDELTLFCHPSHPLAQPTSPITDNDLLSAQWILRESGSGTRQTFERAMHDLLFDLSITLELQLPSAIKQAVLKNLGIGCLSKRSLLDEFETGKFVELTTDKRDFTRHYSIIMHKKKYQSADLKRWLDICLSSEFG
ncbi:MAG: LysR family transcriptional regulator [Pseudomonadota bacterium]